MTSGEGRRGSRDEKFPPVRTKSPNPSITLEWVSKRLLKGLGEELGYEAHALFAPVQKESISSYSDHHGAKGKGV